MMKKFLLNFLVFLLTSFASSSQSFLLQDANQNLINNGDTLVVTGDTTNYLLSTTCVLTNASMSGKLIQVAKTPLSIVVGTTGNFDFGSMMYDTAAIISNGDSVGPGSSIGFNAIYHSYGIAGTSYFNYKFFDTNNNSDSLSVVIEFRILLPTGIENTLPAHILTLSPNPGNGNYTMTFSGSFTDELIIEVYDNYGRSVFKDKNVNCIAPIELSNEPNGVYLIKVINKKKGHYEFLKAIKY